MKKERGEREKGGNCGTGRGKGRGEKVGERGVGMKKGKWGKGVKRGRRKKLKEKMNKSTNVEVIKMV